MSALHIVFDGSPPEARFVEVETPDGFSINAGQWRDRADGLTELIIPDLRSSLDDMAKVVGQQRQTISELREALRWITSNYDNQDMGHRDFRIEANHRARAALKSTGE